MVREEKQYHLLHLIHCNFLVLVIEFVLLQVALPSKSIQLPTHVHKLHRPSFKLNIAK